MDYKPTGQFTGKTFNQTALIIQNTVKEKILNPKVSVIVPVYNTEKYLSKCLASLIQQTLKEIEIIIVNDGSTDNSLSVILEFQKIDARIKVINQENKLQGAARNNGMMIAAGEYIGFVDSDDWVDLNYYEKLYNAAKKYNSDIALATNVRIGNGKTKKRLNIEKEEFITTLQGKMDICNQWKDGCSTNKIYRYSLLTSNNITWPEGCYCEDKLFTAKALFYANGVVAVPKLYYYYFRNPNSTVNSKKGKHNKAKRNDRDNARRAVLNFLKENNAALRDKDFWAIKKDFKLFGITIYRIKESFHTERHYLFSILLIKEVSKID